MVSRDCDKLFSNVSTRFFKEFIDLEKREEGSVFNYPSDKIVTSEIALEARLTEQYVNMFQTVKKTESKETPVIKLFDE